MRMESWGILVVYIVFVSSFLGLTARMWSTRHDFCMAARLPVLVCIGTIGNVFLVTGVFFHWLMLYEDQGLPCYAMSGASNICKSQVLGLGPLATLLSQNDCLDSPVT